MERACSSQAVITSQNMMHAAKGHFLFSQSRVFHAHVFIAHVLIDLVYLSPGTAVTEPHRTLLLVPS